MSIQTILSFCFRDKKSFFADDFFYCLLLKEQKDFDYVRFNSLLKPSEMCGVVLGIRCSLGESDKLNWTINVPSLSSSSRRTWKDRESFKNQRTRIHNELQDHKTFEDEEDTRRISRIPAIQGTMKTEWNNKNSMENERNHIIDKNKMKDGGVNSPKNNDDTGLKKKPLKFLQITDIHLDPYFKTGSRTDCGEPVCCRSDSGRVGTISSMAGVCGEYMECDTPYFTVENTLKRIRSSHPDIDLWLMTGDLLPHDIWEYNRNDTLAQLRFTTGLINQYSRDTPVLPLIGNHEAVPVNR